MSEFIYQKTKAPCGIAVEEIYGADEKSAKVWKLFAMQILSEADGDYREIAHLDNGAPLLDGVPQRVSVSHTSHHLVMASIPKTPDINLEEVSPRTAIGIDIEKADRKQVVGVREKFLSADEMKLLPEVPESGEASPETVKDLILAWTCKEALYKAALGLSPDWKEDYRILSLPKIADRCSAATPDRYGRGAVRLPYGKVLDMLLSSWMSEGEVVTLAFSPKIPIFK